MRRADRLFRIVQFLRLGRLLTAQKLAERIKHAGYGSPRVEGLPAADWVLVDAGDVIVHLFRPEVRSFYNLERMWGFGDAPAAGAA